MRFYFTGSIRRLFRWGGKTGYFQYLKNTSWNKMRSCHTVQVVSSSCYTMHKQILCDLLPQTCMCIMLMQLCVLRYYTQPSDIRNGYQRGRMLMNKNALKKNWKMPWKLQKTNLIIALYRIKGKKVQ